LTEETAAIAFQIFLRQTDSFVAKAENVMSAFLPTVHRNGVTRSGELRGLARQLEHPQDPVPAGRSGKSSGKGAVKSSRSPLVG
jgi:hypothetical protein